MLSLSLLLSSPATPLVSSPSSLRLPPPPRHLRHLPCSLVFIFVRRHGHRLDHRDPPPLLSLSFLSLCCHRYRRSPETPPPPLSSPTTAPTVDLLLCPQEKLPSSSSSAAPLLASVDGTSVAVAISFDPRGSLLPNFAASLFCPSFLLLLRRDPVAAAEAVASILRRRPHLTPLPLLPPLFPPSPSFAATAVTLLLAAGIIFSLSFSINCLPPPVFFLLPSDLHPLSKFPSPSQLLAGCSVLCCW